MDKRGTNKFNVYGINVNGLEHVFQLGAFAASGRGKASISMLMDFLRCGCRASSPSAHAVPPCSIRARSVSGMHPKV